MAASPHSARAEAQKVFAARLEGRALDRLYEAAGDRRYLRVKKASAHDLNAVGRDDTQE